jgi:hypothetical protein
MKKFHDVSCLALFSTFLLYSTSAFSQVYSGNVVGYINLPIYAGDNLIANQLDNNGTNNLNSILSGYGNVPDGATFTKWDSTANTYLPLSVFSSANGLWSINYNLTFGEGGILHSPTRWTNTFVGNVGNYTNLLPDLFPGGIAWNPDYADGLHLISCPVPLAGPISSMFMNVTARLPQDGEWVRILDPATQSYTLTTFHTGTGWDNGDPALSGGQSAWFNLGPVPIPEPSTLALVGLGTVLVMRRRRATRS